MNTLLYKEGINLSRNFNKRSLDDSKKLYAIIQTAVDNAQNTQCTQSISFLAEVYEPYIKKISYKAFSKAGTSVEFQDALQETYVTFVNLIYKYNKTISSFSYYINNLLPQYMHVWAQKVRLSHHVPVDIKIVESTLGHPLLDTSDKVFDSLNIFVFEQEYLDFIEKRALKISRSKTVKEVCIYYFLGHESCSTIAQRLGITYHAVYEIINKIKEEVKVFLSQSAFCYYHSTSTGINW